MFVPVPSPEEMSRWDTEAIRLGMAEEVLMESAARCAMDSLRQHWAAKGRTLAEASVLLLAGSGNNGGDAFCMARHLLDAGARPVLVCTRSPEEYRGNLPKGLDDDVHEGGSNFSVGERQLICMARALLRKPKILIMDEATASLDNTTDTFLQQMIRKQFAHCTTLTIAHRLNTIMDSTRVCVMDQGVVAEFDTPYNLLHKEDGIFKGMVMAANDPSLFDMVPGCEEMKKELEVQQSKSPENTPQEDN